MKKLSKAMAAVLAGGILLSGIGVSAESTDVQSNSAESGELASPEWQSCLDDLAKYKIFEGDENGDFTPYNNITRAEIAKVLCKVSGLKPDNNGAQAFSDVDLSHWAYGYVNTAAAANFVEGTENGTFSPDADVTYDEVVKMLVSVLGYAPQAEQIGGYPDGYIETASRIGLSNDIIVASDMSCPRYMVFTLMNNALDIPFMVQSGFNFSENAGEYSIADGKDGRSLITLRNKITEMK